MTASAPPRGEIRAPKKQGVPHWALAPHALGYTGAGNLCAGFRGHAAWAPFNADLVHFGPNKKKAWAAMLCDWGDSGKMGHRRAVRARRVRRRKRISLKYAMIGRLWLLWGCFWANFGAFFCETARPMSPPVPPARPVPLLSAPLPAWRTLAQASASTAEPIASTAGAAGGKGSGEGDSPSNLEDAVCTDLVTLCCLPGWRAGYNPASCAGCASPFCMIEQEKGKKGGKTVEHKVEQRQWVQQVADQMETQQVCVSIMRQC